MQDRPLPAAAWPRDLYVGTSGYVYDHWRGILYSPGLPKSRWLEHYMRSFDTVELNGTFYRLPSQANVAAWRARAGPGFVFAAKASRYITHMRKLREPRSSLQLLYDVMRVMGPHLGPILFQLPPFLKRDEALLRDFVQELAPGFVHVVEFRHPSWFVEDVYALLDNAQVATCTVSGPGLRTPVLRTGPLVYLRFHGASHSQGRYSIPELETWAEEARRIATRPPRVPLFAYFNNDWFGYAVHNAREMRGLLGVAPIEQQHPQPHLGLH